MSSRLVQLDFTYIFSFRNFIGKATAKQLIITFYFMKSLRDIFVFIQSSRNHRIASELRYMVLKVCMVIVIIFSRSLFIGKVFAFEKKKCLLLLLFERCVQVWSESLIEDQRIWRFGISARHPYRTKYYFRSLQDINDNVSYFICGCQ